MLIDAIGPYSVCVYLRGEPWGQPLSVGRDSELTAVLPFKFNNVRDVGAHYDELLDFVAALPSGTFTDASGKVNAWRIEVRPR